jgi:hypothetical protein
VAIGLAVSVRSARGDDVARARPPVELELADCLADQRDAIARAVRVELGQDAPAPGDPAAAEVRVECAPDGLDAGVVLAVRPPGSARRYRYALDWHAQPLDARPRLVGLAVAEAVDASRIELTALPEPAPPAVAAPAVAAPPAPLAPPDWTLALVGARRSFSADHGIALLSVGVKPSYRLSGHLRLAADLMIEGTTVLTSSGAIVVRAVSAAPRLAYRTGAQYQLELGVGLRGGGVQLAGEAFPGSSLAGSRQTRGWLGPITTLAASIAASRTVSFDASLEIGVTVTGATARDLGQPVAVLGGVWTAFAIGVAIAL